MATDDPAPASSPTPTSTPTPADSGRPKIAVAAVAVLAVIVLGVLVAVPILFLLPFLVAGGLYAGRRRRAGTAVLIVFVGLPAIGLAVMGGTILKLYRVPSPSMAPTFAVGDHIAALTNLSPHVGDVVAVHPPAGAANPAQATCGAAVAPGRLCARPSAQDASGIVFLKRIVAGPGDSLAIRGGRVIRNGVAIREPYATACPGDVKECNYQGTIRVPAGEWYVLGDNRPDSEDSRFWGPVKTGWIVGVVVLRYWPPGSFGSE